MNEQPKDLRENLNLLHTTRLGNVRIRKNLSLNTEDVVGWCRKAIQNPETSVIRKGKNWYAAGKGFEITVNASSYTIITAHSIRISTQADEQQK